MKRLILISCGLALAGCEVRPSAPPPDPARYEICVQKGIEFYKTTEDWNRVDYARRVRINNKVTETCSRNPGNFGPTGVPATNPPTEVTAEVR